MQFPALLLACGLSLLALAYVLYPLYRGRIAKPAPATPLPVKAMLSQAQPASDSEQAARLSLQEVELDYQLGNIAEADYRSLRERYIRRAIVAMKSRYDNAPTGNEVPENEQAIQDTQNGQVMDVDLLIEEQLRKMREQNDDGDEDKENTASW